MMDPSERKQPPIFRVLTLREETNPLGSSPLGTVHPGPLLSTSPPIVFESPQKSLQLRISRLSEAPIQDYPTLSDLVKDQSPAGHR